MMNKKHETYNFVLVLTGFSKPSDYIEDALFKAGCDDALLSIRNHIPYLEFARKASNIEEAIFSAIKNVESANIGAKIQRIEFENIGNASEINKITNKSMPIMTYCAK